jgi:FlaA1/EpsC-like NDP-sugar epimerase
MTDPGGCPIRAAGGHNGAQGRDVFVLDMGKAIRIADLARRW